MTTFDEHEQGFEKKFAHDQEQKFLAKVRPDKRVAGWAAGKLGMTDAAAADYVRAVCKAELSEPQDEKLVRKIQKDFQEKGLGISDVRIRQKLTELLAAAVAPMDRGA